MFDHSLFLPSFLIFNHHRCEIRNRERERGHFIYHVSSVWNFCSTFWTFDSLFMRNNTAPIINSENATNNLDRIKKTDAMWRHRNGTAFSCLWIMAAAAASEIHTLYRSRRKRPMTSSTALCPFTKKKTHKHICWW